MKEIYLTQGKITLVDDEDYNELMLHEWYYRIGKKKNYGYAASSIRVADKQKTILMHNLIMCPIPSDLEVDHIDRNGLNNQQHNLRLVTQSQQKQNQIKYKNCSSIYKGVSRHKPTGKWQAYIQVNGVLINLGCHPNEIAAAEIYDLAARIYFGEFARLNFSSENQDYKQEEFNITKISQLIHDS